MCRPAGFVVASSEFDAKKGSPAACQKDLTPEYACRYTGPLAKVKCAVALSGIACDEGLICPPQKPDPFGESCGRSKRGVVPALRTIPPVRRGRWTLAPRNSHAM